MKRTLKTVLLILAMSIILTSCGNSVVGVWYSDRDNLSALTLTKDGTYSDGVWLTSGNYTVDGNQITMTGAWDGTTILQIKSDDNGDTILYFDNGDFSHTYYKDAEKAKAIVEERQKAEETALLEKQKAEEEAAAAKAAEEIQALQEKIIGYWYAKSGDYPVQFTEDGEYIDYTAGEKKTCQYEIISGDNVQVTMPDGTSETYSVSFSNEELRLNFSSYEKALPLELTTTSLVGIWEPTISFVLSKEFTEDGEYIVKGIPAAWIDDDEYSYSIVNDHSINIGGDDGTVYLAFLSETETQYQLVLCDPSSDTYNEKILYTREKAK